MTWSWLVQNMQWKLSFEKKIRETHIATVHQGKKLSSNWRHKNSIHERKKSRKLNCNQNHVLHFCHKLSMYLSTYIFWCLARISLKYKQNCDTFYFIFTEHKCVETFYVRLCFTAAVLERTLYQQTMDVNYESWIFTNFYSITNEQKNNLKYYFHLFCYYVQT